MCPFSDDSKSGGEALVGTRASVKAPGSGYARRKRDQSDFGRERPRRTGAPTVPSPRFNIDTGREGGAWRVDGADWPARCLASFRARLLACGQASGRK